MKITVSALKCNFCGDIIFSRTHHDFHYCSCKRIFVDGGGSIINESTLSGYSRYGYVELTDLEKIKIELDKAFPHIKQAKFVLFNDWNSHINNYGIVKSKEN